MPSHTLSMLFFSTYVTGFCTLLARYFPGCASRSISMRPRTEFAKGSNFRNLDLFGSGYAGLVPMSQDSARFWQDIFRDVPRDQYPCALGLSLRRAPTFDIWTCLVPA